jgi:hypothetical protein
MHKNKVRNELRCTKKDKEVEYFAIWLGNAL